MGVKMMKRLLGLLCLALCGVSAVAKTSFVVDKKETIFTVEKKYGFYESLYEPKIPFLNLEAHYRRKNFINPSPEYISFYTVNAMKEGNYDNWLEFWNEKSRLSISKKDEGKKGRKARVQSWESLLGKGKTISLVSQIQVGKAQYTYSLIVYEISGVGKPDTTSYIYLGFALNKNGAWRLSEEVKEHPVFVHYIAKNTGKYGNK